MPGVEKDKMLLFASSGKCVYQWGLHNNAKVQKMTSMKMKYLDEKHPYSINKTFSFFTQRITFFALVFADIVTVEMLKYCAIIASHDAQ